MIEKNLKLIAENKMLRAQMSNLSMKVKTQEKTINYYEKNKKDASLTLEKNKSKQIPTTSKKVPSKKATITKNQNGLHNQLENALMKINELTGAVNSLITELKEARDENKKQQQLIEKLLLEIERLKTKNKKDSSNSSKPSGTDGFKKVITNRREKSSKKQGGQKGHEFHSLSEEKINELIKKGAHLEVIEVNKNNQNEHMEYKTYKVIDLKINTIIKEYRYYPDEEGNYNLPNDFQKIVYGENIKAITTSLMNQFPNSTDGVKEIIHSFTNDGINLSKGTLINWTNELSTKLMPQIKSIEDNLLSSYYINQDECQIKINGESSNIITSANNLYTRMFISKHKSHEDLETIGFLPKYTGIIVKDATDIYNGFGRGFSQCVSHILRYLKGIYDFINHKGPKLMKVFLIKSESERQSLIDKNITTFSNARYNELITEYENIIKIWKREWKSNGKNPLYDEERCLLSRMEDNDKEQILYFLKDFQIPFTNNQVEADQRPAKIKQKTGKFRSEDGAHNYAIIRSCVNTYKKHKVNVLHAFMNAFNSEPIIV